MGIEPSLASLRPALLTAELYVAVFFSFLPSKEAK